MITSEIHHMLAKKFRQGMRFFPPPLTGWNICFNLFSMFQTIGREKSQGKGCRHRHKSIMGDPRD